MSDGIPAAIPFPKFKAAVDALGITAKGVYRVEIDTYRVRVERFAVDENGHKIVHGDHLVRFVDEIPLGWTWMGERGPELVKLDKGVEVASHNCVPGGCTECRDGD